MRYEGLLFYLIGLFGWGFVCKVRKVQKYKQCMEAGEAGGKKWGMEKIQACKLGLFSKEPEAENTAWLRVKSGLVF